MDTSRGGWAVARPAIFPTLPRSTHATSRPRSPPPCRGQTRSSLSRFHEAERSRKNGAERLPSLQQRGGVGWCGKRGRETHPSVHTHHSLHLHKVLKGIPFSIFQAVLSSQGVVQPPQHPPSPFLRQCSIDIQGKPPPPYSHLGRRFAALLFEQRRVRGGGQATSTLSLSELRGRRRQTLS